MKQTLLLLSAFIVFCFSEIQAQYTKLFDFTDGLTGCTPHYGALITDGTYLYGTTSNCGDSFDGVVYKIKLDGTDFTVLHDFNVDDGYTPEGSLCLVGQTLYGTTRLGGASAYGNVFKVNTDGTGFENILEFDNAVLGGKPYGGLFYLDGMLYGLSTSGGADNRGTLYRLNPDGSGAEAVYSFLGDYSTAMAPRSDLVYDGTYFYAMSPSGGASNWGVAFRIKPDGSDYMTLVEFTDDPTGAVGYGSLAYDGVEYLYGMTNNGGEYNRGTVFKIKTDGTGYVKLRDFNNDDGAQPLGSLVLDGTTLYGMTELAGSDANGSAFRMQTDGTGFETIIDFDGDNGSLPFGTLLLHQNVLYGFTAEGGLNDRGVIFKFGLSGNAVEAIEAGSGLSIFPNPANEFCTLDFGRNIGHCEVSLYDTCGDLIRTENKNGNKFQLNISDLSCGVYIASVKCAHGIFTKQLIVE